MGSGNRTRLLDAHESRSIDEQLALRRIGSVHRDVGATSKFRTWETSQVDQRMCRVSHVHERQAVRPFPEDASRPMFEPGNVLVGEHFAWPVHDIAEVDIGGLDTRCFNQSTDGNADMSKPLWMRA